LQQSTTRLDYISRCALRAYSLSQEVEAREKEEKASAASFSRMRTKCLMASIIQRIEWVVVERVTLSVTEYENNATNKYTPSLRIMRKLPVISTIRLKLHALTRDKL
jgi:hypothetical protein